MLRNLNEVSDILLNDILEINENIPNIIPVSITDIEELINDFNGDFKYRHDIIYKCLNSFLEYDYTIYLQYFNDIAKYSIEYEIVKRLIKPFEN